MSNPEQESQLTADSGEVHQIESRKSALDTYETFYRLYDNAALQKRGFRAILNRVLHIDETEDRSHHFVVAHAEVPLLPIRRKYDHKGVPVHHVPYNPGNIMVASTDGESITEYSVLNAHGTYRAHLNGTTHGYDPIHEKLELSLQADVSKKLITAGFNMATGDGTVHIEGQYCGWILSEPESARIREFLIPRPVISELGHAAIVS
jgi:hypothetical protein